MATLTYIHSKSVPKTVVQIGITPGTGGTDVTEPLRAYKPAKVSAQPSSQERPAPLGWDDLTCLR